MKFAHFADTHLGFQKSPPLQKLEESVFERAVDMCISEGVDFVLLCGDFFHVNIPEMRVQKLAMKKLRDLHLAGIPVYAVYGSHDFSPVNNSAIDLLDAAGYVKKVTRASYDDSGRIILEFITDEKTGAKLTGFSGLKAGRDAEYYESLERESLESEEGFRVFLFHGAISEISQGEQGESIPLSMLPRGFDYYAGGHLHAHRDVSFPDHTHVVYPGTLFAGYHSDMAESARGMRRGFVLVNFDHAGVQSVDLVQVPGCRFVLVDVDANMHSSDWTYSEIVSRLKSADVKDNVVILHIGGELSTGRVTDIDLGAIRKMMRERGVLEIKINRSALRSREYKIHGTYVATQDKIEHDTFQENVGEVRMSRENLKGEKGVRMAERLLSGLRNARAENEKQADYKNRIKHDALSTLELD